MNSVSTLLPRHDHQEVFNSNPNWGFSYTLTWTRCLQSWSLSLEVFDLLKLKVLLFDEEWRDGP